METEGFITTKEKKKFYYMSLNLPPAPLFKDSMDRSMIPQVPLFDLLSKFDGQTVEILPNGTRKTYQISRLPKYLILHAKRFHENNWFVEKNPTLINFPIKNLDMKLYKKKAPTIEELEQFSISELKKKLKKKKIDASGITEKDELVGKLLATSLRQSTRGTKYDLITNICHDGNWKDGTYRLHMYHKATDTWYEMQDLHVWSTETMPQLVALSETYIQFYELKR